MRLKGPVRNGRVYDGTVLQDWMKTQFENFRTDLVETSARFCDLETKTKNRQSTPQPPLNLLLPDSSGDENLKLPTVNLFELDTSP